MNPFKLNQLEKKNLSEKEMQNVQGGNWTCTCSCYYAGTPGGASIEDNRDANAAIPGGGHSQKGTNEHSVPVCVPDN